MCMLGPKSEGSCGGIDGKYEGSEEGPLNGLSRFGRGNCAVKVGVEDNCRGLVCCRVFVDCRGLADFRGLVGCREFVCCEGFDCCAGFAEELWSERGLFPGWNCVGAWPVMKFVEGCVCVKGRREAGAICVAGPCGLRGPTGNGVIPEKGLLVGFLG